MIPKPQKDSIQSLLVFDIEADGLLEDATQIYCISSTRISPTLDSSSPLRAVKNRTLYIGAEDLEDSLNLANINKLSRGCSHIAGHNIISYDLPMLDLFFPKNKLTGLQIIDTLVFSKLLWPDRPLPNGCPTSIKNPETGRGSTVRPHGLEAWGFRVGKKKPEINRWDVFTPEMIQRCEEDVEINTATLYSLLKEAGTDLESLLNRNFNIH